MRIALYGKTTVCENLRKYFSEYEVRVFTGLEKFIWELRNEWFDAVFVVMDNAAGMEGALAAKRYDLRLPVVWFSNDRDFAAQAYRSRIDYFSVMPITAEKIDLALKTCRKMSRDNFKGKN